MDLKLGEKQYMTIHLDGLDAVQEENRFQSPPKWVCSDNTIVKITPDEDGCTCRIEAARPVLLGNAVVTITDRDDSSVPPVIFNITIQKEPVLGVGIYVEPPTEVGKEPPTRTDEKSKHTPLPEGAIQKDPRTGQIRHETDADTGDRGPHGPISDIKIPGGAPADATKTIENKTGQGEKKPEQENASGFKPSEMGKQEGEKKPEQPRS